MKYHSSNLYIIWSKVISDTVRFLHKLITHHQVYTDIFMPDYQVWKFKLQLQVARCRLILYIKSCLNSGYNKC
jgi:hypothetical protein